MNKNKLIKNLLKLTTKLSKSKIISEQIDTIEIKQNNYKDWTFLITYKE